MDGRWIAVPSRGWILPGEDPPPDYLGGSTQRIDLDSGHLTELYTECDGGRRLRSPNDLVFDATGGFWFTDHGKLRPRDRDRGGVFDKSWTRHIDLPGLMPTNICFGGAAMEQAYATLSPQGELVSWPWSPTESPQNESR